MRSRSLVVVFLLVLVFAACWFGGPILAQGQGPNQAFLPAVVKSDANLGWQMQVDGGGEYVTLFRSGDLAVIPLRAPDAGFWIVWGTDWPVWASAWAGGEDGGRPRLLVLKGEPVGLWEYIPDAPDGRGWVAICDLILPPPMPPCAGILRETPTPGATPTIKPP